MFQSQCFLSKNGPLTSIWVAAYYLKRLRRDQIVQTHIPSSVDKILIDVWPTVAYRILAYLLLGVVRIYSKKVEFLLHDCREIITDLNKFVGKKKAVPFREIVNTQDFSVTLPERYELDAFVLDYADDLNKAHTAKKEDIIIQGSFQYEKFIKKCSVTKCLGDFIVEETTIETVSKTSTTSIKLKGSSSAQNPPESTSLALVENCSSPLERSAEKLREMRFSREECLDIEMFYQNDEDHFGTSVTPNIIQGSNFDHSEFVKMMQTERSAIFHSDVEDETDTVERICCAEEKEANFTRDASPDLDILLSSHKIFSVEDEDNFADRSLYQEIALDDQRSVSAANPVITSGKEKLHVEVQSLQTTPDDHKSVTKNVVLSDLERATHSDTCTPLASGKKKPRLKVYTTPDLKVPLAKEPGSTGSFSVRTPANRERSVRKTNKRKCVYDEVTVLSNQTIKCGLEDTRDLVRKRRRLPCSNDLSHKFLEPSVPCSAAAEIVMVPKGVKRKLNDVNQVKTVETVETPSEVTVPLVAVSPLRIVGDVGALETIAPATPVRCSTSSRPFLTPTAADSDGEGPFKAATKQNSTSDFVAQQILLDFMDKDIDGDGDCQKLDGWSTRTRAIAMWLHQLLTSKTKSNEVNTANLSQILDGKLKKESARVFYEILVLRSGEYVKVSQEGPYKDILLQETRAMERKLAKCAV